MQKCGSQRGVALIIALWLIVLLGVMSTSHSRNARVEVKLAQNQLGATKARMLAESGVYHAILELYVDDSTQQWRFDGTPYDVKFRDGSMDISIRRATGFVDLNMASPELLSRLISAIEPDEESQQEIVDAILDWRDKDNLRRLHGAEDRDYMFDGYKYGAADRNFQTVEELRYVRGVTATTFDQLRPFLTVYSKHPEVNPSYAPKELLGILSGYKGEQVDKAAEGKDSGYSSYIPAAQLEDLESDGSSVYHIVISAKENRGASASLEVVLDTAIRVRNKPYTILYWRETMIASKDETDV